MFDSRIRRAAPRRSDPAGTLEEIRAAIDQPSSAGALLFRSPGEDLPALGRAIRGALACPVVACACPRQIGPQG